MSKGRSATSQKSVQDAVKNLTRFLRKLDTIPQQELERSAITLKAEEIAQAPYREGKLERSIYVLVSRDKTRPGLRTGASACSASGYNYAGIQHENTDYAHPVKGKAHFISDPFEAEIADLKKRLQRELKISK